MMPEASSVVTLLGGRLALDFVNAPSYPTAPFRELSWEDLIAFLEAAAIVSHDRGSELLALSQTDPHTAEMLLARAAKLRRALNLALTALVNSKPIERLWVDPINEILRITEGHDELVVHASGWKLEFIAREGGMDWLLAAIARSAAEILVEGPQARVRVCANPGCGLFFCDTSRTHRRRWCSMAVCGNRNKVSSFARRQAS
jgi:predicted RNA-binding Zn ribbon-like protein